MTNYEVFISKKVYIGHMAWIWKEFRWEKNEEFNGFVTITRLRDKLHLDRAAGESRSEKVIRKHFIGQIGVKQ